MRVLLIEDNPDDALLVKEAFGRFPGGPWDLEWVDRLSLGFERLAAGGIDVILADLCLPDSMERGLDTYFRLRSLAPDIPIVLLTGTYEEEELAREALEKGAQDYLVKEEVNGKMLCRALQYAVKRRELDRMKEEFIRMVSHELRTPLAAIREGVSQMSDGLLGPPTEQQRSVLSIILEDIDRLGRIVGDVLDISRLEAAAVRLQRRLVDLVDLAGKVVKIAQAQAASSGIRIQVSASQPVVKAYADPDRITQVFMNLLNNALKFTAQGVITLSIADAPRHVECSVADTGSGIAEEDLPKVFGRFQQFHRSAGHGRQGTGLGLFISKGLVELHGGAISVKSVLGRGTTVAFTLPKYSPPEIARMEQKEPAS